MSNIGVLIELDGQEIKVSNYSVMTAGRAGGRIVALVLGVGDGGEAYKRDLERFGAEKIVYIPGAGSPAQKADLLAAAVAEFDLQTVMGLSSSRGRDLLARCACKLNAPLALDVTQVNFSAGTVLKSHFSGKTIATLKLAGEPMLIGMRPNVIEAEESATSAQVFTFAPDVGEDDGFVFIENKKSSSDSVDLTEAEIIITGGRPMNSSENFKILYECAEQLGAAVGASRAAVDAGFAPHSMQVGQTGKTVSPKLYIGCGLSGSVQHFAGMKTSKVIVGINTDKDAPIFGKCDYGIVGDLFEVVPVLTEVLKNK